MAAAKTKLPGKTTVKPPPPKPSAPDLHLASTVAAQLGNAFTEAASRLGAAMTAAVCKPSILIPQVSLEAWRVVKRVESVAGNTDDAIKAVVLTHQSKAAEGGLHLSYAPDGRRTPAWKAEAIERAAEVHALRAQVRMYRATLKTCGVNVDALDVTPDMPFNPEAYAAQVLGACPPSNKVGVQIVSLV